MRVSDGIAYGNLLKWYIDLNTENLALAYPSPAKNNIIIEGFFLGGNGDLYKLFTGSGQFIESKAITSNRVNINIAHLKPGRYLIQIIQQGVVKQTIPFIKIN
jgi:hypothetical protein